MKKIMVVGGLWLLLGLPLHTIAAQQTTSKVGITFQQPTTANQRVPLEQVSLKPEQYAGGSSKRYPQTNEQPASGLSVLGVVITAGVLVLQRRKVE